MNITIKGCKIWATGSSHVISIPAAYIKNGLLKTTQTYELIIVPVKEKKVTG